MAHAHRADTLAAMVLIGGLQDRDLIAGPWRADRKRALAMLLEVPPTERGERFAWVSQALGLLGFEGRALGRELKGIRDGRTELGIQVLLLEEAERLEQELGR